VPAKLAGGHGASGGRANEIFINLKNEIKIHESDRFLARAQANKVRL